ncbi:MAG: hypothetical protein ACLTSX_00555 [Collinsella sp.]
MTNSDSAMNYPLRDAILGFLVYGENAYQCAERIETLRENYPPEALACCLNLLGSHDKPRIASRARRRPSTRASCPRRSAVVSASTRTRWAWLRGRFWPRHAHADDASWRPLHLLRRRIRPRGPLRSRKPPHAAHTRRRT